MFTSCNEFLEPTLRNKTVNLVSPSDSATVNSTNTILFIWDPVAHATSYNHQIIKLNESGNRQVIADTSIVNTKLSIKLNPSVYVWRVRALNNSSNTQYSERKLLVK